MKPINKASERGCPRLLAVVISEAKLNILSQKEENNFFVFVVWK
jgi:hypothetical protein